MNDRVITLILAKAKEGPTENRPFRVAAYCRLSSPSEEQELSLETVVVKQSGNISLENLYQAATLFSIGDNPLL